MTFVTGSVTAGVVSGVAGLIASPIVTMLVARPPLLASTIAAGATGRLGRRVALEPVADGATSQTSQSDDGPIDQPTAATTLRPGLPFRCVAGDHRLAVLDALPIVGFIRRQGRCRCGAPIPRVHSLVELLCIAAAVLVGLRIAPRSTVPAFVWLAVVLVLLTVIDAQRHLLPTKVVYPATAVGIVLLGGAAWWQNDWSRLGRAVLAALAASAFLWVLVLVLPTGMGQGDARLSMLLGLFLGWQSWRAVYTGLLLGFFLGAVGGLLLIARLRLRGRKDAMKAHIAFGPYLALGAFAVSLWPSLAGG